MSDYTDPLGKWWLEHKAEHTDANAPGQYYSVDSLAMLRAYGEWWGKRITVGGDIFEANRNQLILNQATELEYLQRAETAEAQLAEARKDSARLREALTRIRNNDIEICGCINHADPECCNQADEHCAWCIADAALAESQPKESK